MSRERKKYNFTSAFVITILVEVVFFALVVTAYILLDKLIPGMRYENPLFVWLFLAMPIITILYLWSMRVKNKRMKYLAESDLIPYLIPQLSTSRSIVKFILFRLGIGFVVIGMIDPKIGTKLQEVTTSGQEIYIALDISKSMLAEDIKPNRLDRSKMALKQLIKQLKGDRIGVVIFAGGAYVQLPLTTDYEAAKLFIDQVDTELMSSQGTAIGDAIELASESFDPESESHKTIILITDGEDHEGNAITSVEKASDNGITIHTIGMGTPKGAPIPKKDRYGNLKGYKKDKNGTTVITALNENMLHQIVDAGNGIFVRATTANVGLGQLMDEIEGVEKTDIDTFMYSEYEHRFQWFFAAGLLFLFIELLISGYRKKWSDVFGILD